MLVKLQKPPKWKIKSLLSFLAQYGTHFMSNFLRSDYYIIIRSDEPRVRLWLNIVHLFEVILVQDVG